MQHELRMTTLGTGSIASSEHTAAITDGSDGGLAEPRGAIPAGHRASGNTHQYGLRPSDKPITRHAVVLHHRVGQAGWVCHGLDREPVAVDAGIPETASAVASRASTDGGLRPPPMNQWY
jgi:hypothetical protein